MFCTCSSVDRATVSGTVCRGFESLQVRFYREYVWTISQDIDKSESIGQ